MRRSRQHLMAIPLVLAMLLFAACGSHTGSTAQSYQSSPANPPAGNDQSSAQTAPQAQPAQVRITVPAGTEIHVRLADTIGSARNRSGDQFAASLAEPIDVNGEEVAPGGAEVTGRVTSARPSGHLKTPAELAVTLTAIQVDGQSYEIRTSNRVWASKSHKKRNAAWIGGATGAGALIGALVGHGEGAAIGAGIGAGGGAATAYATGKKDIVLPSETRLNFVLRQPLTVAKST